MGRTGRPSGGQSPTRGGRGVAGVRGGEQGVSRDGVQEMAGGGGELPPTWNLGMGGSSWRLPLRAAWRERIIAPDYRVLTESCRAR